LFVLGVFGVVALETFRMRRKALPRYVLGVKEVTVVNSVVTALTTLSISKSI
jgi:hypothetical protein